MLQNNMKIQDINWNKEEDNFYNYLYSLQEEKYKDFAKSLIPGNVILIGIRLPILKKIAKEIMKTDYKSFLNLKDNNIFEVKMLKAFVIANIKDLKTYLSFFTKFIQTIDNWSICDSFIAASKIIEKNRETFYTIIEKLLVNKKEFNNRVGFVILLNYYIVDEYIDDVLTIIDLYKNDTYYANMALAWLLCEAYIKYPQKMQTYLSNVTLNKNIKKNMIRKIKDSYRVPKSNKEWLKKID